MKLEVFENGKRVGVRTEKVAFSGRLLVASPTMGKSWVQRHAMAAGTNVLDVDQLFTLANPNWWTIRKTATKADKVRMELQIAMLMRNHLDGRAKSVGTSSVWGSQFLRICLQEEDSIPKAPLGVFRADLAEYISISKTRGKPFDEAEVKKWIERMRKSAPMVFQTCVFVMKDGEKPTYLNDVVKFDAPWKIAEYAEQDIDNPAKGA